MQFEMRLNTLVLRIKSQATLYSSEEFSPAIFPDLDIYIYMSRSLLQGFLEVQELEFWTCLCHHQRSTFLLKQVISEFILVFDICGGGSSWIPVSQCEE